MWKLISAGRLQHDGVGNVDMIEGWVRKMATYGFQHNEEEAARWLEEMETSQLQFEDLDESSLKSKSLWKPKRGKQLVRMVGVRSCLCY